MRVGMVSYHFLFGKACIFKTRIDIEGEGRSWEQKEKRRKRGDTPKKT